MALSAAEIRKRFDGGGDDTSTTTTDAPSAGAKIRELFPTEAGPATPQAETSVEPNPMLRTNLLDPNTTVTPKAAPPFDPDALTRTLQAAREGWEGAQHPLEPAYERAVEEGGPMGRYVVMPAIRGVLGAGAAIGRGIQQGVMETANQLVPGFGSAGIGRDLAAMPEAFAGTPRPFPTPPGVKPPQAAPPRYVQEYYGEGVGARPDFVPPEPRPPPPPPPDIKTTVPPRPQAAYPGETGSGVVGGMEKLNPDGTWSPVGPNDVQQPGGTYRANMGPSTTATSGSTATAEAPAARSVGAMGTPVDLTKFEIDEAKAQRTHGEMSELMQTPQKGDAAVHVEGVLPTKAEIEQSAPVSRESKLLRQEFREAYSDKEKADMERIHDKYDTMAGTPVIRNSMERAADERATAMREDLWNRKTSSDVQPMLDYQSEVLQSEDGRRPVVRNAMKRVIDELYDTDGKLIDDPKLLYGVRKHLNDVIDEQDAHGKPANVRAMAQLLQMRDVLDGVMERSFKPGNHGWKDYLTTYANDMKPINTMKFLQDRKLSLTVGSDRAITFGRFDKFMKDMAIDRATKGVSLAESVDEETRQGLMGIWRQLARSASDQELAKVRGSDTTQLFMELLRKGAIGAVHAGVGYYTGGLGNAAIPLVQQKWTQARQAGKLQSHLEPKPKPSYRNYLEAP